MDSSSKDRLSARWLKESHVDYVGLSAPVCTMTVVEVIIDPEDGTFITNLIPVVSLAVRSTKSWSKWWSGGQWCDRPTLPSTVWGRKLNDWRYDGCEQDIAIMIYVDEYAAVLAYDDPLISCSNVVLIPVVRECGSPSMDEAAIVQAINKAKYSLLEKYQQHAAKHKQ